MEIRGTDFTKRRKDCITFTLPEGPGSEDGFEIGVLPPTKRIYDGLADIAGMIDRWTNGEDFDADGPDMDAMLETVANAMSHNVQMRRVTPQFLDDIGFDMSDIGEFVGAYLYFISQLVDAKNSKSPSPSPSAEKTEGRGASTDTE